MWSADLPPRADAGPLMRHLSPVINGHRESSLLRPDGLSSTVEACRAPEAVGATEATREPSIVSNAAWAAIGSCAAAGGQWLILVLLAKLGTPTILGRFALGLAVTGPIMLLANLQLRSLQAVDATRRHSFGDYLALRIATTCLAILVIGGCCLAPGRSAESSMLILSVGVWRGMDALGEIAHGLFQQRERMDLVACSQILRAALALAALAAVLAATGNLVLGVWTMAGVGALAFGSFELPLAVRLLGAQQIVALRPRWNARELRRLASRAFPLGVAMMLSSLLVNIPRYAISHNHGEAALGAYAAVASLLVVVSLLTTALGQSASPRLARLCADGQWSDYHRLILRLVCLGAALGAAGLAVSLLFGGPVLTVLFDATYARHVSVFQVVMLASAIASLATPLGFALTAGGHHAVQIPLLFAVALGVALCSWLLVPRYGPLGAAWTLVAGYLMLMAGSLVILVAAELRRRRQR